MSCRVGPLALIVLLASSTGVAAAETTGAYKHMGAASCATSVCHSKLTAQLDRNVALNEYRTWLENDRHSRAYRTLETPRSKAMAAKLGLASATTAKICLDCHADNAPAALRGPKFQIDDGVSCEACHGGAERWIETHAQRSATHAANVSRGMYPSELPERRAALCTSCHLGTRDKFATHVIMGAGHPRLSFELETYTANQPAHFVVDEDYVRRKGRIGGMNLWLAGQLESAKRYLALLQTNLYTPGGLGPELAFYDCFGCHHPIDKLRWTRERAGAGVEPGTLRLQRQHLLMLHVATEVVEPNSLAELAAASNALIRAGTADVSAARAAAKTLATWLTARDGWLARTFSAADLANARKTLIRYAAQDGASDFASAEQIVLGVESLSYSIGDRDRRKSALDALYNTVKSSASFDPQQFANTARGIQGQL